MSMSNPRLSLWERHGEEMAQIVFVLGSKARYRNPTTVTELI